MRYKNTIIPNHIASHPIILDFQYEKNHQAQPVVILAHGFKGFKDWGGFNQIANIFNQNGLAFLKFNFSHNGGTIQDTIDCPSPESFGNNNYSIELEDLKTVTNWIENVDIFNTPYINKKEIYLIGHSRGGGVSIIHAANDKRIKKLITWASVSDFVSRLPNKSSQEEWIREGIRWIENGRTKQRIPMYKQFLINTLENAASLSIQNACKKIHIPSLIIHGSNDTNVPSSDARDIHSWIGHSELKIIHKANHVFDMAHPTTLPLHDKTLELITESIQFLKR